MTKKCFRCLAEKQLDCFHKNSLNLDGHTGVCKACKSLEAKSARKNFTPEQILENKVYEHSRYLKRKDSPGYKARKARVLARIRRSNPLQHRAHKKVCKNLKNGNITKGPCEVCGTVIDVQAHHDDYSKPLDVRWLCRPHHQEHHQNNPSTPVNPALDIVQPHPETPMKVEIA